MERKRNEGSCALPGWVRFANAESESNFNRALAGERNYLGRKPLLIISGPSGAGKSALARFLLEGLYGDACVTRGPVSGKDWDRLLPCLDGKEYLFLDNLYGKLRSADLINLVDSGEIEFRKLWTHELHRVSLDLMVVITDNGLELSEDVARRAWFVDLREPVNEPPKDGGWYRASGNISCRDESGRCEVRGFDDELRYRRDHSFEGWVRRDGMNLKGYDGAELHFHYWEPVDLVGKTKFAEHAMAVGAGCIEAAHERAAQCCYEAFCSSMREFGKDVPKWSDLSPCVQESIVDGVVSLRKGGAES